MRKFLDFLFATSLTIFLSSPAYADLIFNGTIYPGPPGQPRSSSVNLTATGTNQAGALALIAEFNEVTTVAAGSADGVRLPDCLSGYEIRVRNSSASALKVYPFTGESIDNLAANASVSVAGGTMGIFSCVSATKSVSMLPGTGGGGAVDSVFSRTGAVAATAGDYTADKVTNVPAGEIQADDVQEAINEIELEKAPN